MQVLRNMPYRGPQMQTLAARTGMLAHDNVTQKRYLLAVEVPGMLENRPVVVYGSRVHITYKVGLFFYSSDVPTEKLRMILQTSFDGVSPLLWRKQQFSVFLVV